MSGSRDSRLPDESKGTEGAPDTATREQAAHLRPLGEVLIAADAMTKADVDAALSLQRREGMRFGDAAVQLGSASPESVQEALSKQFRYTYLATGAGSISTEVSIAHRPHAPAAEAIRGLRSQILLRAGAERGKCETIAVVSPDVGDGRSYVAANLAVGFAQTRLRTLLIDADLRRPRQHEIFAVSNTLGLATILAKRGANTCLHRVEGVVNLSFLCSGPTPPNPQELLSQQSLPRFLDVARRYFDIILIDTSAATSADAALVANRCSGALVVVRRHETRLDALRATAAELSLTQAKLLGVVLNQH